MITKEFIVDLQDRFDGAVLVYRNSGGARAKVIVVGEVADDEVLRRVQMNAEETVWIWDGLREPKPE